MAWGSQIAEKRKKKKITGSISSDGFGKELISFKRGAVPFFVRMDGNEHFDWGWGVCAISRKYRWIWGKTQILPNDLEGTQPLASTGGVFNVQKEGE